MTTMVCGATGPLHSNTYTCVHEYTCMGVRTHTHTHGQSSQPLFDLSPSRASRLFLSNQGLPRGRDHGERSFSSLPQSPGQLRMSHQLEEHHFPPSLAPSHSCNRHWPGRTWGVSPQWVRDRFNQYSTVSAALGIKAVQLHGPGQDTQLLCASVSLSAKWE